MIATIIAFTKTRAFIYLLGCFLAIVLLWAVYAIGNSIQAQRDQAALKKLSDDNKASAARVVELEKQAAIDAFNLGEIEKRIAQKDNQLLDLNAELIKARERSNETRIKYVTAKSTVKIPVYITGDALPDSRELCARLRQKGDAFACSPTER